MSATLFPIPPPPDVSARYAVFSGSKRSHGPLCFIVSKGGPVAALACARRQGLTLERGAYARRVSDAEYASALRLTGLIVNHAPALQLV